MNNPLLLNIILDANQDTLHIESNNKISIRANKRFVKPTVEQVAWVFQQIMDNAGKGTFRYLIYDRMGFDSNAYDPLYRAGGMAINNAMDAVYNEDEVEGENNV